MSSRNGLRLGDDRNRTLVLLLMVGMLAAMPGCESKSRIDYRLTIVVANSLGSETDRLPQDIRDLLLPIDDCELRFFVPNPTIYRLGYDKSTAMRLSTSIDPGFAGDPNNSRLIRRQIQKHLNSTPIGKILAEPGHSNLSAELDRYLESIDDRHLKLFYSSTRGMEGTHDGDRIHDSVQAVRAEIGEKMCGEDFLSAFVFIDPPSESRVADSEVNKRNADYKLQKFAAENKEAARLEDVEARRKALEEIGARIGEHEDGSDYRFTYELMKNRIYGKRHDEGFSLLRRAASEAIAAGQAEYLLDRIDGEKDLRSEPIWQLAHGHAGSWHPIIHALEHKDAAELVEEAGGGHP